MPIFRSGEGNAPDWCEMDNFELIELKKDESRTLPRVRAKEAYIVCRGFVEARTEHFDTYLAAQGKLNLHDESMGEVTLKALYDDALVFRAMGRWKSITNSGLFDVWTTTPPDFDTPYDYKKETRFDNHYHDFDEYWVFFGGECRVASEGKFYDVGPGDCLATGMGWHHDVVTLKEGTERVNAVFFEGTQERSGRTGHLWEPKHGKAEPQLDRV